jgi:hypothetical protein
MTFCGTYGTTTAILLTNTDSVDIFPEQAVEGYGVGTPNFKTGHGTSDPIASHSRNVVPFVLALQSCNSYPYFVAVEGNHRTGVAGLGCVMGLSTVYAITIPWPDTSPTANDKNLYLRFRIYSSWDCHWLPTYMYQMLV